MMNDNTQLGRIIVFAVYSIVYELIVWGIFGWAIFWQGHSGWWALLALLLSIGQLPPQRFGIRT